MTDSEFKALCNTYGFAPSRALRELIDNATAVAEAAEREACATLLEGMHETQMGRHNYYKYAANALRELARSKQGKENT